MQLTWLGHASWLLETTAGKAIYIDPHVGDYVSAPKADVILVTHSHFDHSDTAKIAQIKQPKTAVMTSVENADKLGGAQGLAVGQVQQAAGVTVHAVAAYNINKFRAPSTPYHPKDFGIGFVIETREKGTMRHIYHAGDTDYIPEMSGLGPIDIALLPIGGTYTMTADEALGAIKAINPTLVVPMHFNTPSLEIPANPNVFKQAVEAQTNAKAFIFTPGETQEI